MPSPPRWIPPLCKTHPFRVHHLKPYLEASLVKEVRFLQQLPAQATSAQIDRYRPSNLLHVGGWELFLSD